MRWLKLLYKGWMKFAHAIGRVNTAILLTIFYFTILGIGRIALFFLKKDLMDSRRNDSPNASYWKKREGFTLERTAFLRPF